MSILFPRFCFFDIIVVVVVISISIWISNSASRHCFPRAAAAHSTSSSHHETCTSWTTPSLSLNVARDMAISSSSAVKGVSWAVICLDRLFDVISKSPSLWTATSLGFEGDVNVVNGVDATAVVGAVVPVVDVGPERDVFAVSLLSPPTAPELLEVFESSDLSRLISLPDPIVASVLRWLPGSTSDTLGRLLGTRLGTRLWLLVPPGLKVPLNARLARRVVVANASDRENAPRDAWCAGSILPRYFDFGISLGL